MCPFHAAVKFKLIWRIVFPWMLYIENNNRCDTLNLSVFLQNMYTYWMIDKHQNIKSHSNMKVHYTELIYSNYHFHNEAQRFLTFKLYWWKEHQTVIKYTYLSNSKRGNIWRKSYNLVHTNFILVIDCTI